MDIQPLKLSKTVVIAIVVALMSAIWPSAGIANFAHSNQPAAVITNPILDTTSGVATFTAQIRCVGQLNHPPLGVVLSVQTDQGFVVSVSWPLTSWDPNEYAPNSSFNQQGFRDFNISWALSRPNLEDRGVHPVSIERILSSKGWSVSAQSTSCDNRDIVDSVYNRYSTPTRFFDGPRTEVQAVSRALRDPSSFRPLEFEVQTFWMNQSQPREASDLFSISPTCEVITGLEDQGPITDEELELLMELIEPGAVFNIRCGGGVLREVEQWRSESIFFEDGELRIIGENQWSLAPNHFSDLNDNSDFQEAAVRFLAPMGASDAVYVFTQHGRFGPPGEDVESSFALGALLSATGESVGVDYCYSTGFSAIAASTISRFAVAAGKSLSGSELMRVTFDENSATCAYSDVLGVVGKIQSIVIENRTESLVLHGSTISRVTIPEVSPQDDLDNYPEPEPQFDFQLPNDVEIQRMIADSNGNLWGVSESATEFSIWALELIPAVPLLQNSEEEEQGIQPIGTVNATIWTSFASDPDVTESLVDFQIRDNILTVTTWDNASDSFFTKLRSFDTEGVPRLLAAMESRPLEECESFLGFNEPCGGALLGVDARNGVTVLVGTQIGRSGPAGSTEALRLITSSVFASESYDQGTLSNDGNHAWLFGWYDATFERFALQPLPVTPEHVLGAPIDQNPVTPPSQDPVVPAPVTPPTTDTQPPSVTVSPPVEVQILIPLVPRFPSFMSIVRAKGGDDVEIKLNRTRISEVRIAGIVIDIVQNPSSITFKLPLLAPGAHDIQLTGSFGRLTIHRGLLIPGS